LRRWFGEPREQGYEEWQLYVIDLMGDGATFEAASQYAKERCALDLRLTKQLFPDLPENTRPEDWQLDVIFDEAEKLLPNPFN
jgi:hypothetical protein